MRKANITPAQIEQIRAFREGGMTAAETAKRMGISVTSASRYARTSREERVARRADESGKARVRAMVREHGPFPSMDELAATIPDIDPHTIQHHLHTLRTQGDVRFREITAGTNQHRLVGIAAIYQKNSKRVTHAVPVVVTPIRGGPSIGVTPAQALDIVERDVPPIVMAPVTYPLLRALAERKAKIETAAILLEQAGQDDLAIVAYSKSDDYTDLEREAIALLRQSIAAGVVPA